MDQGIVPFSNKSNNNDQQELNIQWKKHFAIEKRIKSISNKEKDNLNKKKKLDLEKASLKFKYLELEQETINNQNDKTIFEKNVSIM
jgi:hypothetical protein